MRRFILGTAGHVDHGKSTLVQLLTGVNPDRLAEEQSRGITIELGFAPLTLKQGDLTVQAGIIDVPGHERFIRHMVAGAGGVDLVMMVIAADEGVMPQTREHLAICELLGVAAGFIVLTKVDLVNEEWLELVTEEVRAACLGSFLADAPIVRFSARSADPQAERERIERAIWQTRGRVVERRGDALFRLPIDRAFTMRGHGTVVTGTVVGGSLQPGEEVALMPGDWRTRTRGFQFFNETVERLETGMRAAINLAGVEKATVERGMVVVRPQTLEPVDIVDVRLTYLAHNPKPLAVRSRFLCHVATAMAQSTVQLYGRDELQPGATTLARLHLDQPLVMLPGDRAVLRGFANIEHHGTTVGGVQVLHLASGPYRSTLKRQPLQSLLETLNSAAPPARVHAIIAAAGAQALPLPILQAQSGLGPAQLQGILTQLSREGRLHSTSDDPPRYLTDEILCELADQIVALTRRFLADHPLVDGFAREDARSQLRPKVDTRVFQTVLDVLLAHRRLVVDREQLGLPGRSAALTGHDAELAGTLLEHLDRAGLTAPRVSELAEQMGVPAERLRSIIGYLQRKGEVVRVADQLYCRSDHIRRLREQLIEYLVKNTEITTQTFKDLTGVTRKHLIPLAEYFDQQKVTVRKGEVRTLGRSGRAAE